MVFVQADEEFSDYMDKWVSEQDRLKNSYVLSKIEWIKVTDKLPEAYQDVLLNTKDGMFVGYFSNKRNSFFVESTEFSTERVTHWMKLPKVPE